MKEKYYRYFIYLAIVAGIGLRLYGAFYAKQGLSHDESVTYQCAAAKEGDYCEQVHAYSDTVVQTKLITQFYQVPDGFEFSKIATDLVAFDIHPPLYFWALHIVYKIIGLQPFTGLLINIACTILMCILLYKLSMLFFHRSSVALTATALWLLSPAVLQIDLEARHYQLFGLLALWHVYLSYKLFIGENQKSSVYLSLICCTVLGLLTHYYYAFVLLPSALLALFKFRLTRKFWLYGLTMLLSALVFYFIFPGVITFFSAYMEKPKESSFSFNLTKVKVFIYCTAQFFTQPHYFRYLFMGLFTVVVFLFLIRHRSYVKTLALQSAKGQFFILYFTWFAAFSFLFYVSGISPAHAVGEQYFSYLWPLCSILVTAVVGRLFQRMAAAIYLPLIIQLLPSAYLSIQKSQYIKNIVSEAHNGILKNADLICFNDNMRGQLPRFCLNLEPEQRILISNYDEKNITALNSFSSLALVEFYEGRSTLDALADSLKKAGFTMDLFAADTYKLYYLKR